MRFAGTEGLKISNVYRVYLSFDQVIGTLPLILMVLSLTDPRNEITAGLTPLLVGLAIGVCHMAFAFNCGCAINPARDFGPRIFTAMIYGKQGKLILALAFKYRLIRRFLTKGPFLHELFFARFSTF